MSGVLLDNSWNGNLIPGYYITRFNKAEFWTISSAGISGSKYAIAKLIIDENGLYHLVEFKGREVGKADRAILLPWVESLNQGVDTLADD